MNCVFWWFQVFRMDNNVFECTTGGVASLAHTPSVLSWKCQFPVGAVLNWFQINREHNCPRSKLLRSPPTRHNINSLRSKRLPSPILVIQKLHHSRSNHGPQFRPLLLSPILVSNKLNESGIDIAEVICIVDWNMNWKQFHFDIDESPGMELRFDKAGDLPWSKWPGHD